MDNLEPLKPHTGLGPEEGVEDAAAWDSDVHELESVMVQEPEDVVFYNEYAFLDRYTSASQGTFEFGLNVPRCCATVINKISSPVTLVSVILCTSSCLPLNVWTSSAIIVILFFTGSFLRDWYLAGHFATTP
jgi:hypothetical protein